LLWTVAGGRLRQRGDAASRNAGQNVVAYGCDRLNAAECRTRGGRKVCADKGAESGAGRSATGRTSGDLVGIDGRHAAQEREISDQRPVAGGEVRSKRARDVVDGALVD
jgi:hypothetical protein